METDISTLSWVLSGQQTNGAETLSRSERHTHTHTHTHTHPSRHKPPNQWSMNVLAPPSLPLHTHIHTRAHTHTHTDPHTHPLYAGRVAVCTLEEEDLSPLSPPLSLILSAD